MIEQKIKAFESCFHNSPVAAMMIEVMKDPGGEPIDFEFRYLNDAFGELEGVFLDSFGSGDFCEFFDFSSKEWLAFYSDTAFHGTVQNVVSHSPKMNKYLNIQCYQPMEGFCACILTDVTKQHLTELELSQSRQKLMAAIGHAGVQFWEYDMHTNTAYISDFSGQIYHVPHVMENFPESYIARGYIHADSENDYRQMHIDIKNGAEDIIREFKIRTKNNNPYAWVKIHYTTIFDENHNPIKAMATASPLNEYKELEERFVIAAQQSHTHVWRYDFKEKKIILGNTASISSYTQYQQEDGENVIYHVPDVFIDQGFVHPDDVAAFRNLYQSLWDGEKTITATYRWKNKETNTYIWNKVYYTTVFDNQGVPRHAIGTALDITEQKELETKYNETISFHRNRIDEDTIFTGHCNISTNQMLEVTDLTGCQLLENLGTVRDTFFTKFSSFIVSKEEQAKFLQMFLREPLKKEFENNVTNHTLECTIKLPNQETEKIILFAVNVMKNPDTKELVGFLNATDVTQKKLMKLIIEQSVRQDYDYIAYIDARTEHFLSFVNENSNVKLPPSKGNHFTQEMETNLKNCVLPLEKELVMQESTLENVLAQLEKKEIYTITFTAIEKHGGLARKKLKFSYVNRDKKILLLSQRDITDIYKEDQKKNQALADALASAEQANKAKSEFLSRMSHEIRTPMNAIIGMSAIAAQAVDDEEQIKDCICKIGISSRFLLSLINDILDMSRIESGKILLNEEKFLFEDFINGVNTVCYTQAAAKNIDYECIVDHSLEDYYISDTMKLQQIIVNILSNAVKFTEESGRVVLNVTQKRKTKNHAVLRFTINDTGCGIDEAFIPHLFEPFTQENGGITSMYGGTGLGLAICKNIVDMMDGSIDVRSIKNIGTEFCVEVKVGITEENRIHHQKKIQYNFSELKTLVVDDDAAICESAILTLKEMGIKAEWVDSGIKAVEVVRRKWESKDFYHMILLDWKMPEMDGIETAKRIRKIVGSDVTIIIMTSYDWVSIEHEAKLAGINLLMSKPMFKSNLVSAFEKALHQKTEPEHVRPADIYDFVGKRILLCEDHPLNVEVAKKLLTFKGIQVEHAENGLKAIEMMTIAPEGYYDAILMDIRMPVMDGLTASRSIRHLSKPDAKTIPIIAMTANAFEDDVEKSKQAGMNAHLAKPIEPSLLYRTLSRFLSEKE